MKNKILILLFFVIILAAVLRLIGLGSVPSSPNWDEVSLGYNAYSMLQTGRDEYGKLLPFVLRSYDDYKPAFYAYAAIPSVGVFGLTSFAVRLPSALFGMGTVLAVFFLVRELLSTAKHREYYALLSSLLLAISPWHIHFSRIAFESNVGLSINIFAALLFVLGLRKHFLLPVSAFLLGLNVYVYQSDKVFTPLLFLILVFAFRKNLFSIPRKFLAASALIGLVVILPMAYNTLFNKESLSRAQGVSVFSDTTPLLSENAQKLVADSASADTLGLILDNRRVHFIKTIVSGYLSHFDLNWLFLTGDLARHHAPHMGLLYIWELPFLLIGIYMLLFSFNDEKGKRAKLLIILWFLAAPIPASITSGVPHAVRTLNFLPTFQIFTAIGVVTAALFISNIKYQRSKIQIKYVIFILCTLFFIFNFLYYLDQYFVQQNYYTSQDWQYGYKEAVGQVKKIEGKYDRIVVSNKPHLDQSYMFFLFYLKHPPSEYQKESLEASGGFRENHIFGKYEFREINWETESKTKTLFVGRPEDFPPGIKTLQEIKFLDGKRAISIVEE